MELFPNIKYSGYRRNGKSATCWLYLKRKQTPDALPSFQSPADFIRYCGFNFVSENEESIECSEPTQFTMDGIPIQKVVVISKDFTRENPIMLKMHGKTASLNKVFGDVHISNERELLGVMLHIKKLEPCPGFEMGHSHDYVWNKVGRDIKFQTRRKQGRGCQLYMAPHQKKINNMSYCVSCVRAYYYLRQHNLDAEQAAEQSTKNEHQKPALDYNVQPIIRLNPYVKLKRLTGYGTEQTNKQNNQNDVRILVANSEHTEQDNTQNELQIFNEGSQIELDVGLTEEEEFQKDLKMPNGNTGYIESGNVQIEHGQPCENTEHVTLENDQNEIDIFNENMEYVGEGNTEIESEQPNENTINCETDFLLIDQTNLKEHARSIEVKYSESDLKTLKDNIELDIGPGEIQSNVENVNLTEENIEEHVQGSNQNIGRY